MLRSTCPRWAETRSIRRWAGHRRDSPRGFWRFCRVGISEPVPLSPPVPLSLPFPFRRPIRCPFGQQQRQCFDFARDSKHGRLSRGLGYGRKKIDLPYKRALEQHLVARLGELFSRSVARSVARSANNNGNAFILRGIRSAI